MLAECRGQVTAPGAPEALAPPEAGGLCLHGKLSALQVQRGQQGACRTSIVLLLVEGLFAEPHYRQKLQTVAYATPTCARGFSRPRKTDVSLQNRQKTFLASMTRKLAVLVEP